MITSSGLGGWPGDAPIEDWREANLTVPCRVRFKLFTLDRGLVLRRLGALSARDRLAAGAALDRALGAGAAGA